MISAIISRLAIRTRNMRNIYALGALQLKSPQSYEKYFIFPNFPALFSENMALFFIFANRLFANVRIFSYLCGLTASAKVYVGCTGIYIRVVPGRLRHQQEDCSARQSRGGRADMQYPHQQSYPQRAAHPVASLS